MNADVPLTCKNTGIVECLHGLAKTLPFPIGGVEHILDVLGVLVVVPPKDKLRLNFDPPKALTGEQ